MAQAPDLSVAKVVLASRRPEKRHEPIPPAFDLHPHVWEASKSRLWRSGTRLAVVFPSMGRPGYTCSFEVIFLHGGARQCRSLLLGGQ
eukprot:SAG22_NODE_396_length_11127_cov_33.460011_8_plen_88_part_00